MRLASVVALSGEVLQRATIARASAALTPEPGDVVATGTPPGAGRFRAPRRLLREGDEVVVSIERIGALRDPVRVTGSPASPGEDAS